MMHKEFRMTVKRIDHITINVKDLDASLAFYRDVIGLERLESVDMGDHALDYMSLPGGMKLELISYKFGADKLTPAATDAGIFRHIAFALDDLDAVLTRCESFGTRIRTRPQYVEKLGCRIMLIEDPNGIELEFMQKS
jgi:catechol 2,3-dioxygenase-like lactoylglutathione lyase family enzyme